MIGQSNELLKIEEIISKVAPTNSRDFNYWGKWNRKRA